MENEPQPKTGLDQLQEAIANASSAIEAEFDRTTNDWLSCFGSMVFVVDMYLSMEKVQELLAPDKYQEALSRLKQLKERLRELREQYPEKTTIPPDEIKQELLDALDVLK
ncbi:MAG: hypothetical protein A3B31_02225 [Candidatus Komeilibacteria bacterium RIFCSPLOWO2_01_FULL_53_11]|uniref:Uncharacterized protein n=1 Tax=Candidatus Komeilibacteria bacterium RIFCSPLOWO2_01_FULL_53_11 TaxID=1798552 RepID=A0A1G2BSZ1_9BACT|nr:MAG: hypothetical protein A3B31_02225 [Candidatus Komeilibacteria bacterium RIFCSPLOWO2_01_FULL_53_11]